MSNKESLYNILGLMAVRAEHIMYGDEFYIIMDKMIDICKKINQHELINSLKYMKKEGYASTSWKGPYDGSLDKIINEHIFEYGVFIFIKKPEFIVDKTNEEDIKSIEEIIGWYAHNIRIQVLSNKFLANDNYLNEIKSLCNIIGRNDLIEQIKENEDEIYDHHRWFIKYWKGPYKTSMNVNVIKREHLLYYAYTCQTQNLYEYYENKFICFNCGDSNIIYCDKH